MEELDAWLSSTVCMAVDVAFIPSFKQSGYGCSGAVKYETLYTGIHRVLRGQRNAEVFEVDLTIRLYEVYLRFLRLRG